MNRFIKLTIVFLVFILISIGGYYLFLIRSDKTSENKSITSGQNSPTEPEPAEETSITGEVACKPEKKGFLGTNCEVFIKGEDGENYVLLDFDIKIIEGEKYEFTGFKDGISDDGYVKFTPNSYAKI